MILQLFNPHNYAFTLRASSVIFVGAGIVCLGVFVLVRERWSGIGIRFWLFTMTTGLWLLSFGMAYASLQEIIALRWFYMGEIGVLFIPAAIFSTNIYIIQKERELRLAMWICVAVSAIFCGLLLGTDLFLVGLYHHSWGWYPRYGTIGLLFIGYFVLTGVSTRRMMYRGYQRNAHPRNKLRLKGLMIGSYIGFLAALDFAASLGIPFYPIGYLPIAAYLCIVFWVIVRYRLVDITPKLAANRILETMQGAVIVVDLEGKIRVANRVAHEMLGHQKSKLLGRDLASIITVPAAFSDSIPAGERPASHEMVWPGSRGQQFTVSVSASPLTDDRDDSPVGIVCVAQDITERKQMEERLKQLALYDALTGLPNRTLFFDRMNQLLAMAKRNGYVLALLYMDLNRFKQINDTLGHDVGDMLLVEAGKRMSSCTRKADTIARMGGDEFIGICGRIAAPQDAGIVAEKILAVISEPFHLKEHVCTIGASIGISIYPQDGDDLDILVNKADTAMYCVKECGKHGYAYSSQV